MAFLTITLPAIGAAISAIRVHGEYHRNSDRYSHIVRHLTTIKTEMKYITGMPELCALVKEVNEMTFREVHDWKIIFQVREYRRGLRGRVACHRTAIICSIILS